MPNVNVTEQFGYIDFARLMKGSRFVLTNSGNIQEETTALGVPCLTLLESTERPITVTEGTNTLVGTDPRSVISASLRIIDGHPKTGRIPAFWDGNASRRVVNHLLSHADRIKQLSHRVRRDQASVYSPTHVG
jgi:UDP-N-acetylglucosamine 2-epimerase (non-hydrolysing)